MHSAAVLAQGRVHVSRLDHVDRGGDDSGAEARPKGGGEVAREVICQGAVGKDSALLTHHPRGKRIKKLMVVKRQRLHYENLKSPFVNPASVPQCAK